jgi:hypothetical protein
LHKDGLTRAFFLTTLITITNAAIKEMWKVQPFFEFQHPILLSVSIL